jgi:outer membrane protein OmpU
MPVWFSYPLTFHQQGLNMRRLMTVAAVAAGFLALPVQAEEANHLNMGVHGYFKGYVVYNSQDDNGTSEARSVDIIRDTELHFVGDMTLDNGLTVGADIGADADNGGNFAIADSFVYFAGDWGRVNAGATDGAGYLLQVVAPSADANYDGMDQYYTPFNYAVTSVTQLSSIEFDYDHDMSTPHDKLTYISPVFSGFQVGVSYTPETGDSRGTSGVSVANNEDDFENIIDLAARFENKMGECNYVVGAGYSHADNEDGASPASGSPADDRTQWNVGLNVTSGAWGVGAVYTHDDRGDIDSADSAQTQYVLGVNYDLGNHYVLGASYLNQNNEFGANEIDTARYTGGVTYTYGPGLDFHGLVSYIDHDVDAALGDDVQGTAVMLGTSLTF